MIFDDICGPTLGSSLSCRALICNMDLQVRPAFEGGTHTIPAKGLDSVAQAIKYLAVPPAAVILCDSVHREGPQACRDRAQRPSQVPLPSWICWGLHVIVHQFSFNKWHLKSYTQKKFCTVLSQPNYGELHCCSSAWFLPSVHFDCCIDTGRRQTATRRCSSSMSSRRFWSSHNLQSLLRSSPMLVCLYSRPVLIDWVSVVGKKIPITEGPPYKSQLAILSHKFGISANPYRREKNPNYRGPPPVQIPTGHP